MTELRQRRGADLARVRLARAELAHVGDIVAEAALTACAVPTFDSGIFAESGVGSSTMTMLSQNAARNRNHMTLPRVFHDVFIVPLQTR